MERGVIQCRREGRRDTEREGEKRRERRNTEREGEIRRERGR